MQLWQPTDQAVARFIIQTLAHYNPTLQLRGIGACAQCLGKTLRMNRLIVYCVRGVPSRKEGTTFLSTVP
jgi:hypothetical protein